MIRGPHKYPTASGSHRGRGRQCAGGSTLRWQMHPGPRGTWSSALPLKAQGPPQQKTSSVTHLQIQPHRFLLKHSSDFLETTLLRYNSYIIQYTHLKHTVHHLKNIFRYVQPSTQLILEYFCYLKKKPVPSSSHSLLLQPPLSPLIYRMSP